MTSVEAATAAFVKRAEKEGLIDVAYTTIDTPVGPLGVAVTDAGLVKVALHPGDEPFLEELAATVSPRIFEQPRRLDAVRKQLDEYFEGRRTTFNMQIDWQLSHGFRRMVLETLFAQVRYGQVVSYGELASRVGHPRAARAVGTAMATNPVPIVVPCHRVLRSGGDVGNYGGGPAMKRQLLSHEGALLFED
jgi:methylated-DNA-[protein]-cysteine S-methyltransferase